MSIGFIHNIDNELLCEIMKLEMMFITFNNVTLDAILLTKLEMDTRGKDYEKIHNWYKRMPIRLEAIGLLEAN